MKKYLFFYIIASVALFANTASLSQSQGVKADLVTVIKSKRKMYLSNNGKILKTYNIALGANPVGAKRVLGDRKTPEGYYRLDYLNDNSSFYKALHISYPNREDCKNARKVGRSPGGLVMIHGQPNNQGLAESISLQRTDWTAGCIALLNRDMDEMLKFVKVGTIIHIKP